MGKDLAKFGFHFDLALTPLADVYFERQSAFDNVKHGDKSCNCHIFLSIAILILLIACINFMNLSTIRAVERSKEVGLRKVMGALRNHLIWQFIGESVLLTFISCALSIGLLQLLMPFYNEILGYSLTVSWNSFPIYMFWQNSFLIALILAEDLSGIFSLLFPPIEPEGKIPKTNRFLFRQSLVVCQFSISVIH